MSGVCQLAAPEARGAKAPLVLVARPLGSSRLPRLARAPPEARAGQEAHDQGGVDARDPPVAFETGEDDDRERQDGGAEREGDVRRHSLTPPRRPLSRWGPRTRACPS